MWPVIGQDRAITVFQRSLEKGTLAHAYLLVGLPHVGKMTLALNLAQAVNCEATEPPCGQCGSCRRIAQGSHADVQVIGLGGNGSLSEARPQAEIGIAQIREIQHSASLPPFEGRYRIYIIDGAEQLSIEAANCLLKTLEEPAAGVIFVLLTVNDRLLPATVANPIRPGCCPGFAVVAWGGRYQRQLMMVCSAGVPSGWKEYAALLTRTMKSVLPMLPNW